jgi:hypothetical protein
MGSILNHAHNYWETRLKIFASTPILVKLWRHVKWYQCRGITQFNNITVGNCKMYICPITFSSTFYCGTVFTYQSSHHVILQAWCWLYKCSAVTKCLRKVTGQNIHFGIIAVLLLNWIVSRCWYFWRSSVIFTSMMMMTKWQEICRSKTEVLISRVPIWGIKWGYLKFYVSKHLGSQMAILWCYLVAVPTVHSYSQRHIRRLNSPERAVPQAATYH